jgi:hypothetical protein
VRPDGRRPLGAAALALLMAAGLAAGCGSRKPPGEEQQLEPISYADSMAADSAEAALARAAVDSVRAATAVSVQSVRVRDWLDSLVTVTPGVSVQRIEGPFPDHRTGKEADGAGLTVRGKFGALRGAADPTALTHQKLQDAGWEEDIEYSADGPDGTTFGMRKDGILCFVEGRWNGGDGSDPSYVPPDDYTVTIQCTRASDR